MTSAALLRVSSDAESRVLAVLWREGPSTSDRVIAALAQESWQVSTIKTLLARLVKKRAIRAKKEGRRVVYSAALTRQQWVTSGDRSRDSGAHDRLLQRVTPAGSAQVASAGRTQ